MAGGQGDSLRHAVSVARSRMRGAIDLGLSVMTRQGVLDVLRRPLVVAPMGGGPSTSGLVIAAARAGAVGFLAAGNIPAQGPGWPEAPCRQVWH